MVRSVARHDAPRHDAAPHDSPPHDSPRHDSPREGFTTLHGREMYCIPAFDTMPPFLMNIVSDSDLWMYVSSTGGLTAGRKSPEACLFPYETDDRLHHLRGVTGPITLIRDDDSAAAWEPFAGPVHSAAVARNLYKCTLGNSVVFEETHHALGLTFRYAWQNCDEFGFVRTATLINNSAHRSRSIEVIDGLLNVMPAGVQLDVQQGSSCLADAYKVCEVDRSAKLGIFSMSSLITDRAEPAECLRANVVWCRGLSSYRVALSGRQIDQFRLGHAVHSESKMRGQRGNFIVATQIELKPGQAISWDIVADVNRTQREVSDLHAFLLREQRPNAVVRDRVEAARNNLVKIVAGSDGLQTSADKTMAAHHFANVLFNTMRGGSFADGGRIIRSDFARSVQTRRPAVYARHAMLINGLPEQIAVNDLLAALRVAGDVDLLRLGHEYLPLTFARRHGDPSRPWNRFNIQLHDDAGSPVLAYQGNWRDIFQNWEALCLSYPDYLESIIAKFVNASTVDGFNPYRVTYEGIDWETPETENPWANIGYWGDHQIVYLLRLLELSQRYHPGRIASMLDEPIFAYANVPYRIKPYESLVNDCRDTIEFDSALHRRIERDAAANGTDARLLHDRDGAVLHVTLAEKLLVPVLSKLSNLVVGGGIWMNTQRPEWNDANNALAGHGLSVVTLCYLRRHVALLIDLFQSSGTRSFAISTEVAIWLGEVESTLKEHANLLDEDEIAAVDRRRLLDALGNSFCRYRTKVYGEGLGRPQRVTTEQVVATLQLTERFITHSIRGNRRAEGLYHAYNLIKLTADGPAADIERLPLMLEGQVAVLSSGVLSAKESLDVIESLFASDLYRADQQSFLLYPDRPAEAFLQKNAVSMGEADRVQLLHAMLAVADGRIVVADHDGTVRFNADFRNAAELKRRLDEVAREPRWATQVEADRAAVLNLYEATFRHHSFTGRSGSMFGYEGLGCIYWHMVAKLLVAIQEVAVAARDAGESPSTLGRLADNYHRVRRGLGFNKTAREYGAFPTDPYSHTPGHAGARQPGMTGQVKEEMITRLGELGVKVDGGTIQFAPRLLDRSEFAAAPSRFNYIDVSGAPAAVNLPADALAFTFCQVPVVLRIDSTEPRIVVARRDHQHEVIAGDRLDAEASAAIFSRSGEIVRIEVSVAESMLRCSREMVPEFHQLSPEPAVPDVAGDGFVRVS